MIRDVAKDEAGQAVRLATERAVRAIPPAWPLAANVAVNPFLGQSGEPLALAGARLGRVAGAAVTLPRAWYRDRISGGAIADVDLREALDAAPVAARPASLAALKAAAAHDAPPPRALPTIADLAAKASGTDWPGLIAERIGAFAAGYFDEGQALWAAPRDGSAYAAWRAFATQDLTPEIIGLSGFARHVFEAPDSAPRVIERIARRLGVTNAACESWFHQMLMTLGGWSQLARYKLWQAELDGGSDGTLVDLLAIRLVFEEALWIQYRDSIADAWAGICAAHAQPPAITPDLAVDAILQNAAERAFQRKLATTLDAPATEPVARRPVLQAAFCIDVRSEIFRRALEGLHPDIETIGFAGFFGLATAHRRFASDVTEAHLPVLLRPQLSSRTGGAKDAGADNATRIKARAKRAWGRFRLAAVSSFAFVEAAGPLYLGKLLAGAARMKHAAVNEPAPQLDPALNPAARTGAALAVLRAMSMTSGFARLVILAGHGASTVNNPHASSLHCGACGGYPGDVNARLLAALLNDTPTRRGLAEAGITVPDDTLFVAALHDTTTDEVQLFAQDHPSPDHEGDLAQARSWLTAAGARTRAERALRLPRAGNGAALFRRSRDWAETRPEWALAGCSAFIAAPRRRTRAASLEGRAFLHDYDWHKDSDFRTLELILTAPVVVASWISLQYYGSTVAPDVFGGGNKLLHNVVGGVGVCEGNGGLLRAGLPWQSVHDGERLVHEPLRLSVCIEAPRSAITQILARHDGVRALFDNGWLHLFALDAAGRMAFRYAGELKWAALDAAARQDQTPLAAACA